MLTIQTYILSVGAAGLLCAITANLTEKSGMTGKALKLVTGLFMMLTVLQPFGGLRIDDLQDYLEDYSDNAASAVALGEKQSVLALENSIKEKIASYILDKGAAYGAKLTVEIRLDETFPPNLESVRLSGDVSPYAKQTINRLLFQDLGLEEEDILWQ